MKFDYDVFISYKRADGPWAEKLRDYLGTQDLASFRDVKNLRTGEGWLEQLRVDVPKSQHFLLVWSERVEHEIGDIISMEIDHFYINAGNQWGKTRRFVPLRLDDTPLPKTVTAIHGLTLHELIGRRVKDIAELTPAEWKTVSEAVRDELRRGEATQTINLLVLTTCSDWWLKADLEEKTPVRESTISTLTKLKELRPIHGFTRESVAERYPATRQEAIKWRPFEGGNRALKEIVEEIASELTQWAKARKRPYKFEPVSPRLWDADGDEVLQITTQIAQELSLIIIDPLSLNDPRVSDLASRLGECFTSPTCVVVTLSPMEDPARAAMGAFVRQRANHVYDYLFSLPYPPPKRIAHSAVHIGSSDDIKRLLKRAIAGSGQSKRSTPGLRPQGA